MCVLREIGILHANGESENGKIMRAIHTERENEWMAEEQVN